MTFEISDWVKGKTEIGELIYGYVISVHEEQRFVKVHVLRSDNEEIIGSAILVPKQRIKKLPVISFDSEQQLRALIDIALAVRDEPWFTELTNKLVSIQSSTTKTENHPIVNLTVANRLGLSGMI